MGVGAITMPTVVALTEQNSPTSSSTPADKINLTCFFLFLVTLRLGFYEVTDFSSVLQILLSEN